MWTALESYHEDGEDGRVVRPDHPVPPSATLREIAAWMTYVHTRQSNPYDGETYSNEIDKSDLRRYIAKTDYHLRAVGIW
jgi:hypothetical protein